MASIEGNEKSNTLDGGSQADTISGHAGNDTLNGGGENDVLFGGSGADVLNGGSGFDFAAYFDGGSQGVTVNLATGRAVDAFGELDTLSSIEGVSGTEVRDTVTGSNTAERINGRGGNDDLFGGGGGDTISGGGGDDTISGGVGADILTGSFGADTFKYFGIGDSTTSPSGRDIITDFATGVDRIDVSSIDADVTATGNQAFDLISGTGGFTDAGQARVLNGAGGTLVQFNINNDLASDFEILLEDTPLQLTETNFLL
jgi:Ca2+-binding RTX toxin-like protein